MVLPELNNIVVFTGSNYRSETTIFKILKDYVIPDIDKVMKKSKIQDRFI